MANQDSHRRILILHAQAGAGHKRAAESLEEAFRIVDPDSRVHALDTMLFASKLFQKTYAQTYNTIVQRAPKVWGMLYWGLERKGVHRGMTPARIGVDRFNLRRLVKAIERFEPIAVVCTHFLPMGPLSRLAKKGELGAPLYCVVTDFGAHPFWAFEGVTGYFVASPEAREDLTDWRVPWDTVSVTGIPVDLRFSKKEPQGAAREYLGLDPNRQTVLVMGGGNGVGPLVEMARRLLALSNQPQVVVLTGRNEEALHELQQLGADVGSRLRPVGFTDEVDRWLDASDLLVTKSGGLTCSESLAKRVPLVIFRPTPGQEDRNSQALTTVGAALRARTLEQVAESADRILRSEDLALSMRDACAFLGRPNAATDIARVVLRDTAEQSQTVGVLRGEGTGA